MSIPDPMQCGCPASAAVTEDGPYRGPSDDNPTPEDAAVWCSRHTVEVEGVAHRPHGARQAQQPAPAHRVELPRKVRRALEGGR